MNRAQFTFYRSYYDAIRELPKKDQTAVLLAVCAYALDSEEPKLSGTASAIFTLIRPTLDAGRKKAVGGHKGSPTKDSGKKEERCGKDAAKEKEGEKEEEKEKEGEIENECYPPTPLPAVPAAKAERAKRFSPPTVDEVRAYCLERGNHVDAERFVDFYASKGWKVGNSSMKDWKACVRTWEKRDSGQNQDSGFETSNPFLEMLHERRGAQ